MDARPCLAAVHSEVLVVLAELAEQRPQLLALLQRAPALALQPLVVLLQQLCLVAEQLHPLAQELLVVPQVGVRLDADVDLALHVPAKLLALIVQSAHGLMHVPLVAVPLLVEHVEALGGLRQVVPELVGLGHEVAHLLDVELRHLLLHAPELPRQLLLVAGKRGDARIHIVRDPAVDLLDHRLKRVLHLVHPVVLTLLRAVHAIL
mmetsp:Transcript_46804/g.133497  ORF Transcript_46804/g.133497 Transcript_46804/m.133497 type:complete len:206 (+) Transcript_46804:879-1496(+)